MLFFFTAYDVTRRETFDSLDDIWMREVDMYSTIDESVKMVVANKCDKVRADTVPSLLELGMICPICVRDARWGTD